MTDSRWLLEVTEYLLDRCERLGVRSSCSAQEFKLSRSGLLRFSVYNTDRPPVSESLTMIPLLVAGQFSLGDPLVKINDDGV